MAGGARRLIFAAGLLAAAIATAGLGVWQVQRRAWKLDLIQRVEARLSAAPVDAPGPDAWPHISAARDEYRRVSITGRYLDAPETRALAVAEPGAGFWALAPFRAEAGFTVLVNRGFVTGAAQEDARKAAALARGETRVTGLMRMSEPGGGFLRANDPAGGRWYSRDVAAIAQAARLGPVAPFFVDADAASEPGPDPVGGLTRVAFSNTHLIYALTWFSLSGLCLAGLVMLARGGGRRVVDQTR